MRVVHGNKNPRVRAAAYQVRNSAMEVIKKLKPRNKVTPSSNDPGYSFKILHEGEEKQNRYRSPS